MIAHVVRHLYPTRPRFRVHSTVAPRECGIGQLYSDTHIASLHSNIDLLGVYHYLTQKQPDAQVSGVDVVDLPISGLLFAWIT